MSCFHAIEPDELQAMLEDSQHIALLDIRDPMETERGHIAGATNLPRRNIELRIRTLVRNVDTTIITVDDGSGRAELAAKTISGLGYRKVMWLQGGMASWQQANYPVETGNNVPSKRFGEEAQHEFGIPDIEADVLASWQHQGRNLLLFDVRTPAEYEEACIPGAVNGTGFDLALHADDLRNHEGPVVVHCAGRTRSLIAAQTLREVGVDNVFALRNGTMGWGLASKPLERGARRRLQQPSQVSRSHARTTVLAIQERFGIVEIEPHTMASWLTDDDNLYVFDVRSLDEYDAGHVPDSQPVPAGQLVQRADEFIAVGDARIVLIDDDGTRAVLCALWLHRMGFTRTHILAGGIERWQAEGREIESGRARPEPADWSRFRAAVRRVSPNEAQQLLLHMPESVVLDVGTSLKYSRGHLPGAVWLPRAWLELRVADLVPQISNPILLTCDSGIHSVYAAAALKDCGYQNIYVLEGGIEAWRAAGRPLETAELSPQDDILLAPYQRGAQAMRDYLSWEMALATRTNETPDANPFVGLTYGQSLRLIADRFGDREAMVMDERRWTFRDVLREVNRASSQLINSGFRRGDKLALWMPNRPEFIWYWLGASQLGILTVVINTRLKGQEVAYQLAQSESRGVIVPGDGAFKDFIADILSFRADVPGLESIIALDPTVHTNVVHLPPVDDTSPSCDLPLELDAESPALISYSSGTTGMPKGALIAHSLFRKAWDIGSYVEQTAADKLLLAVPLFGSFAMMNGILPCWVRGSAVIIMERFEPHAFLQLAASESCTMAHLLAPMVSAMLELPRETVKQQLSTVRTANVVTLDEVVFRSVIEDLGIPGALIGYGLTEATTAVVRNYWTDPREVRSRSQGFPLPGIEVRVVNHETGRECVADEPGEIWVRGYCIMKGYYNNTSATKKVLDEDGWLHTGDCGIFRKDGRLAFQYRLGDSYKTNGFNISPTEVETVIRRQAGVADVAVFGIADPIAGQVGVACIVPAGDAFNNDEFLSLLAVDLPSYKIPRHIMIMDSFPITAGTGKVKKSELRERYLQSKSVPGNNK